MMSSLRIQWSEVLLVSGLVVRLHVVRLHRWGSRLFKTCYSSLNHCTVVMAFICTRWVALHLVVCKLWWLLAHMHHEVLVGMCFSHVGVLFMLGIRLALCLRNTCSLRARSLLMRLLSVSSILGTNSLSSDTAAGTILRGTNFVLVAHLLHQRVVILFNHFIRILWLSAARSLFAWRRPGYFTV